MLVVHANWFQGRLHLWAESLDRATRTGDAAGKTHAFAASPTQLRTALERTIGSLNGAKADTLTLLLPHSHTIGGGKGSSQATPLPSSRLAGLMGRAPDDDEALTLEGCEVPTVCIEPAHALPYLIRMSDFDASSSEVLTFSHAMPWWTRLAQFAIDSVVDQRVVPSVLQRRDGSLAGQWRPWLSDADANAQLADLIASMPAAVRAVDSTDGHAWPIIDSFLGTTTDAIIRSALVAESFDEAIADFSTSEDSHAGLLSGLLGQSDTLRLGKHPEHDLMRGTRGWLALLDDTRSHGGLRLRFEVREPDLDVGEEGMDALWRVAFGLVDPEDTSFVTDAESVFLGGSSRRSAARTARSEELAQLLLKELGRASRIWPDLEDALEDEAPCGIDLSTRAVHSFMRDIRPVLLEAGFFVEVPEWWGSPTSRISAQLNIDSPDAPPGGGDGSANEPVGLGLQAMVAYRWQVALGGQSVSVEMLEKLARSGSPLVRVGGAWIDLRPEDIASAVKFFRDHPGGNMTLVEALRMAHGIDGPPEALPVSGVKATGWVGQLLDAGGDASEGFSLAGPPDTFRGTLRPYQLTGLSWLAFLDRLGLGACLADDMGLGKTIQLIALLQHERAERSAKGLTPPGPTLLIAPMSVLGNWRRELSRFAPEVKVHIHHGIERPSGDEFGAVALANDLVLTTYAIIVRDRETIQKTPWRRVVLDEAQHIKNPPTKQTAAIRGLNTRHRVALTGTPVENRLAELWSIMEFCCPGYLGTNPDFRRRFATPIERNRDAASASRLRTLVKPFILRRLKTDPKVISDLPPLIESRQSIPLTQEQVKLYEAVVADMLAKVDSADGIRRRGLVLSALVKLKQICNHPAHFLREGAADPASSKGRGKAQSDAIVLPDTDGEGDETAATAFSSDALNPQRSGKTQRLIEMLEELVAAGDRALVFTQYRQMGHLLVSMIRQAIDVESLFLHGGTPQAKRDAIVERFQQADGSHPIFVLSLKAGGVGLNLTAANHVFHFDRWWNPAVENQATDRAFRIGQTRTVNVHKFISSGTLEERIDQMIEQKTELATQIIGAGDAWLTEMSTTQLRDLLSLRRSGLEGTE